MYLFNNTYRQKVLTFIKYLTHLNLLPPLPFYLTYPLAQFFLDEGLEETPDDVEDEGLLDHVHLLQPERHGFLDEGE